MRLFVYEFVTGGGWWSLDERHPPTGSLLREGSAMLRSLVADIARIGEVRVLRDVRCQFRLPDAEVQPVASEAEELQRFAESVQQAEWTVLIAPEFDGHLLRRCAWVERFGGRLLSPGSEFVSVAADKHETARRLALAGVPMPAGCLVSEHGSVPVDFPFPAVLKPRDGAGSVGVRFVTGQAELRAELVREGIDCSPTRKRGKWNSPQEKSIAGASGYGDALGTTVRGKQFRLEAFHHGLPASVAVMSGPGQCLILPACQQQLSNDGRFQYLGGRTPLATDLSHRAAVLGRAVAAAMPATVGYFGVDLVLGDQADGSRDMVIEVNPRLTTSYLGLRRIARMNLAEAMLLTAHGEPVDLSFHPGPVQFATETEEW